jgi:ABC-type sugar transport system permease subunit
MAGVIPSALILVALFVFFPLSVCGAYSPFNYGEGAAKGLQWFKAAKFGMFIHYGENLSLSVSKTLSFVQMLTVVTRL